MAKKGDIIVNTETGDIVEFIATSSETEGRFTAIKFTVKPSGFRPVEHFHPQVDETFKVISGRLTYTLADEKNTLIPGNQITLPKGIPHTHYNNEKEDLVMEQIFTPSLDVEVFLENLFGLTADGKFTVSNSSLLQMMAWNKKLKAQTYLAKIPKPVQTAMFYILAPVAAMLGYKASYEKYNGINL